jgi:alpha-galactosidase
MRYFIILCILLSTKIATAVVQYGTTPGGFSSAPKGWNSFAMQSLGMKFNQENVIQQCDQLINVLGGYGYDLCSLDSGWSVGAEGDEYGRITYDSSIFNIPQLADHLHSKGLKLGVYVVPGYFANDANKTVIGTNYSLSEIGNGHNNGLARIDLNYSHPGAQKWCNSVIDQFAQW